MSSATVSAPAKNAAEEHEILFQTWFKSVGPRTYAAQLKKARNGNHFLTLTEGRRDEATGEVRKCRLFVFSEDFVEFFKMMQEAAVFIRSHPVPDEVKKRQERKWAKQQNAPQTRKSPDAVPPRNLKKSDASFHGSGNAPRNFNGTPEGNAKSKNYAAAR